MLLGQPGRLRTLDLEPGGQRMPQKQLQRKLVSKPFILFSDPIREALSKQCLGKLELLRATNIES